MEGKGGDRNLATPELTRDVVRRGLLSGKIEGTVVALRNGRDPSSLSRAFTAIRELAALIRLAFAVCQLTLFVAEYGLRDAAERATIPATMTAMQNVVRWRYAGRVFMIQLRNLAREL